MIRLVGGFAILAAADKGHGALALGTYVAIDLVAARLAIVHLLDSGVPASTGPALPSLAQLALPPR